MDERDEEIGVISANEILDIVQEYTAIDAYNQGIKDAEKLLQTKFEDINLEVGILKKTTVTNR